MKSDLTLHRVIGRGEVVSDAPDYSDVPFYTRPADWLTVPAPAEGEQKINILVAVFPTGDNFIALKINASGTFVVDWGDGNIETTTSYIANHAYNYSAIPESTWCSRGYRQAIISVTKPDGNISTLDFTQRPSAYLNNYYFRPPILSVKMRAQYIVTMTTNSTYAMPVYCEEFEYYGPNNMTVLNFSNFRSLQKVVFEGLKITNMEAGFYNCSKMTRAPEIFFDNVTYAPQLFSGCSSLGYIPNCYNFSKLSSCQYLFSQCYSLKYLPDIDARNATNFFGMFSGCTSLKKVNFVGGTDKGTSFSQTFASCSSLEEVVGITFANALETSNCFSECYSLVKLPPTSAPKLTTINNMFYRCKSLKSIPIQLTTTGVTSFSALFQECSSLKEAPEMDTSNATSFMNIFNSCSSLESTPVYNTGKLTNLSAAFQQCSILRKIRLSDLSKVTNYQNAFYRIPLIDEIEITFGTTTPTSIYYFLVECYGMRSVKLFNIPADLAIGTNLPSASYGAYSGCQELRIQGCAKTVSIQGMSLNREAIVQVFQDLASGVTGQTISIANNPGTANLTADDRLIATNKGWTISG